MKKNILIATGISLVVFLMILAVEFTAYHQKTGITSLLNLGTEEKQSMPQTVTIVENNDDKDFPYILLEDGRIIARPEIISK